MKKIDWWWNIKYEVGYYSRRLTYPFRKTWKFLTKLWDYAPILYRDEDWDSGYILILLHKKIQRTKNCIRKNANHMDWEQDVAEMQEAEDRLNYLINDDLGFDDSIPVPDYMKKETVAYLETFEYIGQCIRRWWD